MKIEITTDRQPWVDGSPRNRGDIVETNDASGAGLVSSGFAIAIVEAVKEAPTSLKFTSSRKAQEND
jgi:hypothetical protein